MPGRQGSNLHPIFCGGGSSRVKHTDPRARLPISALPFISCMTLDRLLDISVLQFLQVAGIIYLIGLL